MNPATVPLRLRIAALTGRIKLLAAANPGSLKLDRMRGALERAKKELERIKQLELNLP